jgi:parallel beta-helix repeat protein
VASDFARDANRHDGAAARRARHRKAAEGAMTFREGSRGAVAVRWVLSAALAFGASLAVANDGRIPIYQPITISASGSYVVTRDFSITTGSAITILGNPQVSIDFAGHTISAATTAGPVVTSNRQSATNPCQSVSLQNGRIVVATGVSGTGFTTTAGEHPPCMVDVRITNMTFDNAGVWAEDSRLTVLGSRFLKSSMNADANWAGAQARFEGNEVFSADVMAYGASVAQIRNNNILSGSIVVDGSDGFDSVNHIIEGNTLSSGSIKVGLSGSDGAGQMMIVGNVLKGSIQVGMCSGSRIAENIVSGCSPGGTGIQLSNGSSRALIEDNRVYGCTYGIEFDASSNYNAYRNNMLRSNTTPVLNSGTGNTDSGGNIN